MTAPISAHMIGRAGYRTGVVAPASLLVDELEQAIERAHDEELAGESSTDARDRNEKPGSDAPGD